MSFTLHDALVPTWQQILGSMTRLLDKAQAHSIERNLPDSTLIDARLADDMLPFGYQIKSVVVHSVGAIQGVRNGLFSPDLSPWPDSFAGLKDQVSNAVTALEKINPNEINGFLGRDMRFEIGERRMDFTAENFLLSFSMPNFFFHATTAYDILRHKGLTIGKRDFIGKPRVKS
ncbi:DUF1993 domain-containing protein [Rhodoferax sp.]|uniref:DUF1993 domain-containing protein n=1 Tax=Rhodoferax sp. TaxID=50421 RepID=UPI0025E654FC|nr:DUF1993 domain-containing protein [Rhodoferax sp.]MCM2297071.1 DUF1993 domain-containing protein [Rhodoferax sp.]